MKVSLIQNQYVILFLLSTSRRGYKACKAQGSWQGDKPYNSSVSLFISKAMESIPLLPGDAKFRDFIQF